MSNQENNAAFRFIAAAGLIVILALAAFKLARRGPDYRADANPYEYDIEKYKHVDPAQIGYTETAAIPIRLGKLSGLAVDSRDNIYVTGDNLMLALTSTGTVVRKHLLPEPARCLAISLSGVAFLGMTNFVLVHKLDDSVPSRWPPISKEGLITSIAVSETHVYVADAATRTVYRFDMTGKLLGKIDNRGSSAKGFIVPSPYFDLALDSKGTLFVVNPGKHTIHQFTPDGAPVSAWGKAGNALATFCGCCNPTHIAIMADSSFVTSEKGLVRIKIYDTQGKMQTVVAAPAQFDEMTAGIDLAVDSKGRILALDPKAKAVRVFVRKSEES